MSPSAQEALALLIVAAVAFALGMRGFRAFVARPLAGWLLKRGKVKWAMRLRHGRRKTGSVSCH